MNQCIFLEKKRVAKNRQIVVSYKCRMAIMAELPEYCSECTFYIPGEGKQ